ncbi:fumarylacetoacetate hydrolase family protein [Hydrogenophaga sp.]|uniref:fumarylacetoacetate hydrolase family protein n=1 Tax=Hydrogenophaga sp. TaxID=1904254 RepID=UPI0027232908|nr:fumarylacetoacetate hydrolase family protein [Hydrogenophaga sp.]MDO8905083.1 fumarylacetoacetate hydrolase family protein [Hydrogenophaga sp.]
MNAPASAPYLPSGTVYGTLLNFRGEHAQWATRMVEPPYKAPPKAPVLYVKTANTFTPAGERIALPAGAPVEVAASIGLVIGWPDDLLAPAGPPGVLGAVLLNDVAIAHDSYYRPPVKTRCVDGFLGMGAECVVLARLGGLAGLSSLRLELHINGVHRQTTALSDLVRDAESLLCEVNAFMSLREGDVLMLGTDCLPDGTRPLVHVGDTVEIVAEGFLATVHHFVADETTREGRQTLEAGAAP